MPKVDLDTELRVMKLITEKLAPLTAPQRQRVLDWLVAFNNAETGERIFPDPKDAPTT